MNLKIKAALGISENGPDTYFPGFNILPLDWRYHSRVLVNNATPIKRAVLTLKGHENIKV